VRGVIIRLFRVCRGRGRGGCVGVGRSSFVFYSNRVLLSNIVKRVNSSRRYQLTSEEVVLEGTSQALQVV
jgi:hypothetical protein